MNKRQWFASTDPQPMLHFLSGRASDRKLRLFAVACCRRAWKARAEDEMSREAVELAERFADGVATVRECRVARATVEVPSGPGCDRPLCDMREMAKAAAKSRADGAALDVSREAMRFAGAVASAAVLSPNDWAQVSAADRYGRHLEQAPQVALIRCIFGNPFRPLSVESSWLTSDVLALARGMYEARDFGAMPILADALQDAGCDRDDALTHLRHGGDHARGCWVLDAVLGKE